MVSPWEDGTKVRFTEGFLTSLDTREGRLLRDRLGDHDPRGIFTVRNLVEGEGHSLHDVFLEESNTRWGVTYLRSLDEDVRHARQLLSQGRGVLQSLKAAETLRGAFNALLQEALDRAAADGNDPAQLSGYDIQATLRLAWPALRKDISRWEGHNVVRAESWLRAKRIYEAQWPLYPLAPWIANGDNS